MTTKWPVLIVAPFCNLLSSTTVILTELQNQKLESYIRYD